MRRAVAVFGCVWAIACGGGETDSTPDTADTAQDTADAIDANSAADSAEVAPVADVPQETQPADATGAGIDAPGPDASETGAADAADLPDLPPPPDTGPCGNNACECSGDDPDECEKLQGDGDMCNGVLACDTDTAPYKCKPVPASEVKCQPAPGECQQSACDKKTGKCLLKPAKEGQICDKGNPCAQSECQAGACVLTTKLCACASNDDCKDDGDPCNGVPYCDKSASNGWQCKTNPASIPVCNHPASNPCAKSVCVPATGKCQLVPVETVDCDGTTGKCKPKSGPPAKPPDCDDGDACTAGDQCGGGQCQPGKTLLCKCSKDADCAKSDDGNACNGTLYCNLAVGQCQLNPATVVQCPTVDDTACRKSVCVNQKDATGTLVGVCQLTPVAKDTPCNDGDLCTGGDHCEAGQCVPTAKLCTCSKDADCGKYEDGDACNGTLYCDVSAQPFACKVNPKTVVECPEPAAACSVTVCDPKDGQCKQKPQKDGQPCDADGNTCTQGDVCGGGFCKAGTNVCACQTDADCLKQEDGDLCNGTLYCDKSGKTPQCKVNPVSVVACDTSKDGPCQQTACVKATGKCATKPVHENEPCEADGNPCTATDSCQQGQCAAGPEACACQQNSDCLDDGNVCNGVPNCDKSGPQPACKVDLARAVTCTAANQGCLTAQCSPLTGRCALAPAANACDDGNACTTDLCTPQGICIHATVGDGSPCGAGMACALVKAVAELPLCVAVPQDMVLVAGGTLWMGCDKANDPACLPDETPMHPVALSPYLLDRYETTVQQWQACAAKGPCKPPALQDKACLYGQPKKALASLNCVSHAEAAAFCAAHGKRLPSEAESELAARGPCTQGDCKAGARRYPWGNAPQPACAVAVMQGTLQPACDVGAPWSPGAHLGDQGFAGAFDMGGNVREWTADTYPALFTTPSAASSPASRLASFVLAARCGAPLVRLAALLRARPRFASETELSRRSLVNNPGYDAAFYTKPQASQPGAKNDAAGSNKVARGGCGTSAGMELRAAARFGSDKAGPWTGVRCAKDFQ